MPKISVIIPTYNRESSIKKAIESVLNQTFSDFELIIVDDGSTDSTKEIISEFLLKDKRVRYFYQSNSGGPSKPKNTAFKHCAGSYIAYLDSDDQWLSEKLKKQYNLMRESPENTGLVACHAFVVGENDKEKGIRKVKSSGSLEELLTKEGAFPFSSSSIMVKREVIERVGGFDENLRIGEDLDFYMRIAEGEYSLSFVDEPLFKYFVHSLNISGNLDRAYRDYKYLIKKHANFLEKDRNISSIYYRKLGTYALLAGDMKDSRKFFIKAISLKPNLRNISNFIFSILGRRFYMYILYIKNKKSFKISG